MRKKSLSCNDNNQDTYEFIPEYCDDRSSKLPSLTIEGETFSIQELVKRMSNGQIPQIQRGGTFTNTDDFDDPDLEHLNALDISQQYELMNSNAKAINDIALELQKPVQSKEPDKTDVKPPEDKKPE